MASLTPVDYDPFAAPPQAAPGGGAPALTVHVGATKASGPTLTPVDYDPFAPAGPSWLDTAGDIAQSAATGIEKGAIGMATAPVMIGDALHGVVSAGLDKVLGPKPQIAPTMADMVTGAQPTGGLLHDIATNTGNYVGAGGITRGIEALAGPMYKPQTTAGRYAETVGEFLPGSTGGGVVGALKYGVAPGLASEAAGQLTQDTSLEPYARVVAPLLTGGAIGAAGALRSGPGAAGHVLSSAAGSLDPSVYAAAQQLMDDAARRGMQISAAEAIQQVTNGGTRLGALQRVVEQSKGGAEPMAQFYAQRPGQVQAAGSAAIDSVGPVPAVPFDGSVGPVRPNPSAIGPAVQQGAQGALDATPQGQAAAQAVTGAGPRVTPEQVGQVIQPALRGVYDERLGARSAQAHADFAAASRDRVLADGIQGILADLNRQIAADDTGLLAPRLAELRNRLTLRQARPEVPATPATRTPITGPNGNVIRHEIAPGTPAQPAQPAVPITDIENLNRARKTFRNRIELPQTAPKAIDKETAARIGPILGRLDQVMQDGSEAYAAANRNFATNSVPLQPFEHDPAMSAAVERDPFDTRFTAPAHQVPALLDKGGPSTARNFNSVATPGARQAYESHLTTRLLDAATGPNGRVDAARLAAAARENADALQQFPEVVKRIQRVIDTQRATEPLRDTMVGRLAATKDFREQAAVILDPNPIPGSAHEVAEAVRQVAARSPDAARALVSQRIRQVFAEATQTNMGGPNQWGGAKFNAIIRGNDQQARNLKAAVEALQGPGVWRDFQKTLDVFEAMGRRHAPGSQTEFNKQIAGELKRGGLIGEAASVGASPHVWLTKARDLYEGWRYGRNTEELAKMLTRPDAATVLGSIAKETSPAKAEAMAAAYLLSASANQSRKAVH